MIFSYHDLLYLQLSAQTIEKGCCSPFLRFCNSPLSPDPSPLFKKSGVFCKVESSPLLEIIYPYGEQSLSLKGNIYNGNISGFDGKGKFFPAGSKFLTGKEFNSIEFSALRGNKFDLCCL